MHKGTNLQESLLEKPQRQDRASSWLPESPVDWLKSSFANAFMTPSVAENIPLSDMNKVTFESKPDDEAQSSKLEASTKNRTIYNRGDADPKVIKKVLEIKANQYAALAKFYSKDQPDKMLIEDKEYAKHTVDLAKLDPLMKLFDEKLGSKLSTLTNLEEGPHEYHIEDRVKLTAIKAHELIDQAHQHGFYPTLE
jgi:hypothetical protein